MKNNVVKFIVLGLIVITSCSPKSKCFKNTHYGILPQISGIWQDINSDKFTNCYAQFTQKKDSVFMTHFLEFDGEPFYEVGEGIRKGDSIVYHVEVKHQIKGWSTSGYHHLKINKEGNIFEGYFIDNLGNKGELRFVRKR